MSGQKLFYDSLEDAAKCLADSYPGGKKALAARLWPKMTPNSAHTKWLDNVNERRENHGFDADELRLLLRIGREINCHALKHFLDDEANYARSQPIEPEDELAILLRERNTMEQRRQALDERLTRALERYSERGR